MSREPPQRAFAKHAPLILLVSLLCGCSARSVGSPGRSADALPADALPAVASALSVGPGRRFRPAATSAAVARAAPLDGMRCRTPRTVVAAAHLELFAAGRVVRIPAGIGIAPPLRRRGAYVTAGRCAYPVRTGEPTGLLLMEAGRPLTLGRLFDLWGQPLSARTVAGFSATGEGRVSVFLDGRRWAGDPSRAPVRPWAQIAIEVGPYVPPHRSYTFPPLWSVVARR